MEYAKLCIKWLCICCIRIYRPEVVMEIIHDEPQNIVFLITTALLIALAIYVFRFVWVYLLFKDFIIQTTFNPI